jgi:hypothetical protein
VTDPAVQGPPAPHPAIETAYLAPEAVLYDERTGRVYRLNPSASAVWLLLDGTADADAVAGDISEIFEVPLEQVRPDVATAIEEFAAQGLLLAEAEPSGDTAGPAIEVPDSVRPMLTHPPVDGEVAVPLRVFTRGGRAAVVHLEAPDLVDPALLASTGVVEVETPWCFVAPDGSSVSVEGLRWPLAGALVADRTALDTDEARRRLWPLGRGNRAAWEALVGSDGWVVAADGDANASLEQMLG